MDTMGVYFSNPFLLSNGNWRNECPALHLNRISSTNFITLIKAMPRIQYSVTINASAHKVYTTMLGLTNKADYNYWTAAFNPTSTYEGSWQQGSKIYFVGMDEQGKRRGMVSEIKENKEAEFVSIKHVGFVEGEQEITTGEEVEKWTGGLENYHFQEEHNQTLVTVDIDVIDEYLDYFNDTYPKALAKLKEIAEK